MTELRDLTRDDLPRAGALLAACDLPTDDLDDPSIALVGAFEGSAMIGVIGLQACGEAGLLRSLAVEPAYRDRGVARALCERVFAMARGELWLLTPSATSRVPASSSCRATRPRRRSRPRSSSRASARRRPA